MSGYRLACQSPRPPVSFVLVLVWTPQRTAPAGFSGGLGTAGVLAPHSFLLVLQNINVLLLLPPFTWITGCPLFSAAGLSVKHYLCVVCSRRAAQ